jgi:hypothetical protein
MHYIQPPLSRRVLQLWRGAVGYLLAAKAKAISRPVLGYPWLLCVATVTYPRGVGAVASSRLFWTVGQLRLGAGFQ